MTADEIQTLSPSVLERTEPKGLPFSFAPIKEIRGGFRFRDRETGEMKHALDFTMTNAYQTCPLLFMEEFINAQGLKIQKVSLHFGAAYHFGIATWYRTGDVDLAAQKFLDNYVDKEGEELKTRANGERMVRAYAERYPTEQWGIIEIETPILFEFAGGMYHFVIPDMVVRWNGRVYGVEHKHTKSIHRNYFRQFKPNQQLDGQVAGIKAKHGSCDGIIINPAQIQKGGTRGRPSPFISFGPRDTSTRTVEDLEWWRRDMVKVYADIKRDVEEGYFRANRAACHNYEGCAFRELHLNLGDDYTRRELFEPRVWDPSKRLIRDDGGFDV